LTPYTSDSSARYARKRRFRLEDIHGAWSEAKKIKID
jgi:hypothetical protein